MNRAELNEAITLAKRCAEAASKAIMSARECAFRHKDSVLAELLAFPQRDAMCLREAMYRVVSAYLDTHDQKETKP